MIIILVKGKERQMKLISELLKEYEEKYNVEVDFSILPSDITEAALANTLMNSVYENVSLSEAYATYLKREKFNLTSFKELSKGYCEKSIYDYIDKSIDVPEQVIRYLQIGKADVVCLGLYEHPFIKGKTLSGPYIYTDGTYKWDRDTWKYVVKYGLILPEHFIEYVMSETGQLFLKERTGCQNEWAKIVQALKKNSNGINEMPDDAGDESLKDF